MGAGAKLLDRFDHLGRAAFSGIARQWQHCSNTPLRLPEPEE